MKTADNKKKLLIGLPRGFGFHRVFEQSMNSVAEDFADFDISLIADEKNISESFFTQRGVHPRLINTPKSRLESLDLVRKHTHAVLFWDGEELTDLVYFAKLRKLPTRLFPVRIAKVCNKDKGEPFDVYIGRGSPWGNPYPIEHHGGGDTRLDVIEKYKVFFKEQFLEDPEKRRALLSLRGMRLACHCKPMACHGDVIADFLNSYEEE